MSLKMITFQFLLILSVCFLKIKSDTSHLENKRQDIDELMKFLRDPNYRNDIIMFLENPEELAARQNNRISQLRQRVEERVQRLYHAQAQIASLRVTPMQTLNDQILNNNLEHSLNQALRNINEQRRRTFITNEERAENRDLLIRRFQDLIDHLDRTLTSYAREQRVREYRLKEMSNLARMEKDLNNHWEQEMKLRELERNYKMSQAARDSLTRDLRERDEIEKIIRAAMQKLHQRNLRDQPVDDDQYTNEVKMINNYWENLKIIILRLAKQREALKILHQSPAGEGSSGYTGPIRHVRQQARSKKY